MASYSYQPSPYTNPTNTNAPQGVGNQFNIDSFTQPFPMQDQKDELGNFRERFSGFLESQETPQQVRDKYENRYGYQPLRQGYQETSEMMGDLSSAIRARPEQVVGRGRETIVTQGQVDKITQDEVGKLLESYRDVANINTAQGQQLAYVEKNMNEAARLEMARQERDSTPWMMEYSDIATFQAREETGWQFSNKLELDRLLSNQAAGLSWTSGEADRANELAVAELGYKNALDKISKQGEVDLDYYKQTDGLGDIFGSYGY